jgi:hypothetical protein
VRRGRLRLRHPAGHGLLQLGQLLHGGLALGGLDRLAHARGCCRGSRCGRGRWGGRLLHVGLDDAPTGPRAGDRSQVEAPLLRYAAGDRGGLDPAIAGGGRWGGGGSRRFSLGGGCCRLRGGGRLGRRLGFCRPLLSLPGAVAHRLLGRGPAGAVALDFARLTHLCDHLADRLGVPLLGDDLHQRSGGVGLVDHVGLVGLDLDQLVADRDLVADRLQPLQHGALLHRVGEAGHDDVRHLAPSMVASAAWTTCSSWGIAACSNRFE